MRVLASTIVLGLCSAGCWGGGGDCLAEVELEGARFEHATTGDQLIFENGQVILRRAGGGDSAMTTAMPPAGFESVDCRYGDGRPAEHAQRRMRLVNSMQGDVLRVTALDGFRFAATATVSAILESTRDGDVTRREITLTAQLDDAGNVVSIPLQFDPPLVDDIAITLELVMDWDLLDANAERHAERQLLSLITYCSSGSCDPFTSYPAVACF